MSQAWLQTGVLLFEHGDFNSRTNPGACALTSYSRVPSGDVRDHPGLPALCPSLSQVFLPSFRQHVY